MPYTRIENNPDIPGCQNEGWPEEDFPLMNGQSAASGPDGANHFPHRRHFGGIQARQDFVQQDQVRARGQDAGQLPSFFSPPRSAGRLPRPASRPARPAPGRPRRSPGLRGGIGSPARNRPPPSRSRALIPLNRVVLPGPFGPISPGISPSTIWRETRFKACRPPKRLETPCTSSRLMGSP